MSDSPAPTSPDEPPAEPAPPPPEPTPPPRERWRLLPWLTAAGFLILAAALVWVWQHPIMQPAPTEATDSLARQVSALEERIARLERRPAPTAPDLGSLAARVTALEQRPTPPAALTAPGADLRPMEARVAALEQRPTADLQPLENKLAASEARQQQTESGLTARIASLENADRTMQADLSRRTDAAAAHARHTALVEAAALALAAGQKLGDIPGAPQALAKYADADPPTLASLRLAFPAAAREALGAAKPVTEGKPLMTRLWAQAQDLVTVRQGDHVLLGDPVAGVLERARAALDAGDLEAAAAEVGTLQTASAQAMAGWLAQAKGLLAARAALTAWAKSA